MRIQMPMGLTAIQPNAHPFMLPNWSLMVKRWYATGISHLVFGWLMSNKIST